MSTAFANHRTDEMSVPLGVHGKNGSWQVVKRIKEGKPVIIHGDGTSLWTITHNSDFARAYVGLITIPADRFMEYSGRYRNR